MRSHHRGWPERSAWASQAAVRVTVDPSFSLRSPAAGGSAKESVGGRNCLGGEEAPSFAGSGLLPVVPSSYVVPPNSR